MYTRDSALLSTEINRIITDKNATLGAFFTPFSEIIKKLFANNEQGFFYDPNDLSTMFQDAAGTVPVTAVGQPVGLIRDKSGRNNHARQTNSARRPILRQNVITGAYYLEFDGTDDFLKTNNIDFTGTDKVSLFAGVRKLSDISAGTIVESGTNYTNPSGGFGLFAPPSNGNNGYGAAVSGTLGFVGVSFSNYPSPDSAILSTKMDLSKGISSDQLKVRVNAVNKQYQNSNTAQGGNFANTFVCIGTRAGTSLQFNGHIYSLIGVGRLSTDGEIAAIEKELAKRVGVTLNV